MSYKGKHEKQRMRNSIMEYGLLKWIIDGIRINGRLDRINKALALEDVYEFERAIAAMNKQTRLDVQAVKAQHKALARAVKAMM